MCEMAISTNNQQSIEEHGMSFSDEMKVSDEECLEWFDTYRNAYRIAYENHQYMKRWLTKISFIRLVKEMEMNYIEKIDFGDENVHEKILIKTYMREAIENNDPIPMVRAYTEKTPFVRKLNEDLASIGSDFRFQQTFAMSDGIFKDNDPPKDLGQFIYAAILSHHSKLEEYRHFLGRTYRGMTMTEFDLDQYQQGKYVLTRTFLSSSIDRNIAQTFLINTKKNNSYPVLCIYHIRNRSSTIDVQRISRYPNEKEILLLPFLTFEIVRIEKNLHGISLIELEQYISN